LRDEIQKVEPFAGSDGEEGLELWPEVILQEARVAVLLIMAAVVVSVRVCSLMVLFVPEFVEA